MSVAVGLAANHARLAYGCFWAQGCLTEWAIEPAAASDDAKRTALQHAGLLEAYHRYHQTRSDLEFERRLSENEEPVEVSAVLSRAGLQQSDIAHVSEITRRTESDLRVGQTAKVFLVILAGSLVVWGGSFLALWVARGFAEGAK